MENNANTYSPDLVLQAVYEEYLLGENIEINVALVNHSPVALVVNCRFWMIWDYKYREAYELKFDVLDPHGKEILPRQVMEGLPLLGEKHFVHLEPGESCQRTIVISDYFSFIHVGIYQISAEYHNDHTAWKNYKRLPGEEPKTIPVYAWTGASRSNSIQLRVKSADG